MGVVTHPHNFGSRPSRTAAGCATPRAWCLHCTTHRSFKAAILKDEVYMILYNPKPHFEVRRNQKNLFPLDSSLPAPASPCQPLPAFASLCQPLPAYDTISDQIRSEQIRSDHIIAYHIISDQIRSDQIRSDQIISYHIISYHIISYHIISYHIISYHIILSPGFASPAPPFPCLAG